ncbi:MAG TPA: phosphoserine phosphatase [Deltaproteobacteria bacterium]|nr:phosphoserine phosphatase [Deltaproteobacteria bacterium]
MEELMEKRERHNAEAEKHRHHRDRLNEQTKDWVRKRDDLNAQARELIDEANTHKAKRNDLNQEVREIKVQRDLWNRKVNETAEALARKKRDKEPRKGPPIRLLKKRLKDLELQQQTSSLTLTKEKELIDQIRALNAEIQSMEKELEGDSEIKVLMAEASEAREKAEIYHTKVEELAVQSQKEHDTMMEIYDRSDAIRKEADKAQENFIKCKVQADEEHQKHIEMIKQVHDYDKMLSGLRHRDSTPTEEAAEPGEIKSDRDEAKDIYEKFKRGEKLSTEDIMLLQNSGYL